MDQQIAELVGNSVLESLKQEEQKLDNQLEKLNNMDDDDFELLREKRLQQLKQQALQNQQWKAKGHGEYTELSDQKEFFETTKASKHVVVHFYTPTNKYCKIVDKHLQLIASKHFETKFCKINAEKAEYLVKKLQVWMIPTLLLIEDRGVKHEIAGLDELGGSEDFTTQWMEYTLSQHKILKYDGPIPENPTETREGINVHRQPKNSIRQSAYYDSD